MVLAVLLPIFARHISIPLLDQRFTLSLLLLDVALAPSRLISDRLDVVAGEVTLIRDRHRRRGHGL